MPIGRSAFPGQTKPNGSSQRSVDNCTNKANFRATGGTPMPRYCAKRTQFEPARIRAKCFMAKGLGTIRRGMGVKERSQFGTSRAGTPDARGDDYAKRSQFGQGSGLGVWGSCTNKANSAAQPLAAMMLMGARAHATERLAASLRTGLRRQTNPIRAGRKDRVTLWDKRSYDESDRHRSAAEQSQFPPQADPEIGVPGGCRAKQSQFPGPAGRTP
jgi:hypothetical protein